ncbi:MAG: DUF5658 family protein [Terriglobales bacterium]
MKSFLCAILMLCAMAQAENLATTPAPSPDAPSRPSFWTFENKLDLGLLASLVTADAITTQRGLSQGFHEANPLMRPFVTRGAAGEAAGSALGFGAGLGTTYLLHRTHHYKAEHIAMRLMVGTEGAVVAHNFIVLH